MKEMLRGALLSVLFFGLMVGGAPTAAEAYTGGGSSEGNTGILNLPCPPGGSGPWANSTLFHAGCEAWNGIDDETQCLSLAAGVIAAGAILAGIEAHIASGGLSSAALALAVIRHAKALANYMKALGVLLAAGCKMVL